MGAVTPATLAITPVDGTAVAVPLLQLDARTRTARPRPRLGTPPRGQVWRHAVGEAPPSVSSPEMEGIKVEIDTPRDRGSPD
jgi:hypothetical protein